MHSLETVFSKDSIEYAGAELAPHFLLRRFGLKGDALAAFIGPCRVETAQLVDWEDRLASDRIEARWMVHFLAELFDWRLREAVLAQRLMVAILAEELRRRGRAEVERRGDDLFVGDRKLTVSIATASPVSCLIHLGVNLDPEGAPVPAIGLKEMGVLPEELVPAFLERVSSELRSVDWARCKARPVF